MQKKYDANFTNSREDLNIDKEVHIINSTLYRWIDMVLTITKYNKTQSFTDAYCSAPQCESAGAINSEDHNKRIKDGAENKVNQRAYLNLRSGGQKRGHSH